MMKGFRRAQLRGSDELFRATSPDEGPQQSEMAVAVSEPELAPAIHPVPSAPRPGERSLRLGDEEIQLLADALQRLKFPQKSHTRPSVDDFERLEALRQKLLNSL